jgi:hypothetical protein
MKKPLLHLFFFLLISSNLLAQEYVAFEKPIESTIIGNRTFKNDNGNECTLESKTVIKILGRGYNQNKGKYYFTNDECSGFISSVWFAAGAGFKEQDMKVNPQIYEINNARALKEIEEEKQAEKKQRQECAYITNEIDVFDNQRVIRTKYDVISEDLAIQLYSKGSKKKIVFGASLELGCTSPHKTNRSKVMVMLENEDVITFYHSSKLDCGDFELWGNVSNSEIIRLEKSPIKAIKLTGTDYYDTIEKFEWSTYFIDQLKCFKPE